MEASNAAQKLETVLTENRMLIEERASIEGKLLKLQESYDELERQLLMAKSGELSTARQKRIFEVNENDASNGHVAVVNSCGHSQISPKRQRLDEQENEAAKKQLKEYYAKIKSLEKAMEAEKDRAKKFQVELTAKTSLLTQAQEDISTLNETNEKHKKMFDMAKRSFQSDIANLKKEREELRASVENKNETIKKITDQFNGIIKEKTAVAETLKDEVDKLKSSDSVKSQLEKQIEELRENNQALNDERNDLVHSLSELQEKLKSTEEDMSLFETELKGKSTELVKAKEYSPRIKSYEQKTDSLQAQLEELKEEKIALKQEIRTLNEEKLTWMQLVNKNVEHEEIIASLNNELNMMRTASMKLQEKKNDPETQAKLDDAEKKISELQTRLVELEELHAKLKEADEIIENLKASNARYEEIIKVGTSRLNETESALESAETKKAELLRSLEDVQSLLDHLKNFEIKSLNEKLATIESEKGEVESKMVELAMDKEQALVKIKEYETILEKSKDKKYTEEDISGFKKKEESLLKKICALEAELITVSSKEAELQASLLESKQSHESSQTALKKLESDFTELTEREKQSAEKLNSFSTEKEALTHNIRTLEADVAKLKEDLEQKNKEYEELEKSTDSVISDLQKSAALLKDDLNNARKEFETSQKSAQVEHTSELEKLNATIKSLNENIEQVQKSKHEVDSELQKANFDLVETKKSLDQSKAQLEESLQSHQKALKEKKDEMEKLLFKNTELSSKVQEWESKEQDFATEKSSLTTKIATINAEFQRFKEEMDSMRAKHTQELVARKSSVGVNFDMIKTNELLQKENEDLIQQIEDLASKNSDYENMQEKCLLLSHEKEEMQSKIERLERRIQQLKNAGNTSIDSVKKEVAEKNNDHTPSQVEETSTALTVRRNQTSEVEILEVKRSPKGVGSSASTQIPRTKRPEDIKECKQQ